LQHFDIPLYVILFLAVVETFLFVMATDQVINIKTVCNAMYDDTNRGKFHSLQQLLQVHDSELPAEKRIEAVRSAMHTAIEKNEFYSLQQLLKVYGSELPAEEFIAAVRNAIAIYAAIKKGGFSVFQEFNDLLLKVYSSELPAKERIEILLLATHTVTKQGDFKELWDYGLSFYNLKLPVEKRIATVHSAISAMHAAIEQSDLYKLHVLLNLFGSELPAQKLITVVRSAIDIYATTEKGKFTTLSKFNNLLWNVYRSELPAEERIEVLLRAIYVAIAKNDFYGLHGLLDFFSSKLPAKKHREAIRCAIYAAIEQGNLHSFLCLFTYSSELSAEERIAIVRVAIYAFIKQGKFSWSQDLLKSYGSKLLLLPEEVINLLMEMMDEVTRAEDLANTSAACIEKLQKVKSALLSWVNDQCQKISTAYGHQAKAIQQAAIQAQGEALVAAKSIASAASQVILDYQGVLPAEQDIVKKEEVKSKKVRVRKALADLYCTVEYAHQTFLSKHIALHQEYI
jgi:hypothetical protein